MNRARTMTTCLALTILASWPAMGGADPAEQEATMAHRVSGTFEVSLTPHPFGDEQEASGLGRMSIDKRFHGALEATGTGQMLSARTAVDGSAGYVALELVEGTLDGRRGTFVLQHSGTMDRGAPDLTITVVPDSGTGELVGLAGTMSIEIADGVHSYDFEYTVGGGS